MASVVFLFVLYLFLSAAAWGVVWVTIEGNKYTKGKWG